MLDTLIVGAGLCGLSLASKLQFAGRDYLLVEARPRPGGRIDTERDANGLAHDLGPGWFWPETQPRMTRLLADLGLQTFAQHDSGTIMILAQGDGSPEALPQPGVHNGAQRVVGGMRSLVDALLQRLSVERLRFGYEVTRLFDQGTHVEVHCWTGKETVVLSARNVVLALPPRLVEERLSFTPALEAEMVETLRATPTWMASAAKTSCGFDRAWWRDGGLAGNAFVTHPQAVLAEIFDASSSTGTPGALGGFVAMPPSVRTAFKAALPMMIGSQLSQFFGPQAADGELHMRDWATERFTCSGMDAVSRNEHPEDGVEAYARAHWAGKLHFAGSETAAQAAGYMEGALEVAARVWQQLDERPQLRVVPPPLAETNAGSLDAFAAWVTARREEAIANYRRMLMQTLSTQQFEAPTRVAVMEVVGQFYAAALTQLAGLALDLDGVPVEKGRSALTPRVLEPFVGFSDVFLTAAVTHNATSCAISNFPTEHDPDAEYLQAIRREMAAAWREFALSVNEQLLDRAEAAAH
ncbi:flavin monoamine oxidase family protein [Viridibacterium curvum]|uniref:Amine oxidase domain-containing protein n=1 Tax=Viridibacterium curvum TaxID=1101404 RepID=A0ABP9R648_9RHOO